MIKRKYKKGDEVLHSINKNPTICILTDDGDAISNKEIRYGCTDGDLKYWVYQDEILCEVDDLIKILYDKK